MNTIAKDKIWGRSTEVSFLTFLGCLSLIILTPLLVFYFYIAAYHFNCSLIAPINAALSGQLSLIQIIGFLPPFSAQAALVFSIWIGIQFVLAVIPDQFHKILPNYQGGDCMGAITPAGNRHTYRINGLQAWVISHLLFCVGSFGLGLFSATIIFDEWGSLLWVVNIMGYSLAIFAYVKAYFFPSCKRDRKFSGNAFYDFFMGIELNPRVGPIDLKLFFNGRPGIIAWTLINISFAAAQYAKYGMVTNSMMLVNLFHSLYVLYFFWKEAWYLKTIDIHHDHFGWMLAWGDCVWLPYMYTLQGLFLVFHPVELSTPYTLMVLAIGLLGFYIFASANNQKDSFRESEGKNLVWNKKPESILCSYKTQDGNTRQTSLLISGWWGVSRHMNYTGDLLLSLAYSLACGMQYLFPYFYFVFLAILLIHRCLRDEAKCKIKYESKWKVYCEKVPYRLIPKVW